MERCDFSSVITIISDHISESKRGNQSDLMYALFDTFATDEINIEETFDEGAVCRCLATGFSAEKRAARMERQKHFVERS